MSTQATAARPRTPTTGKRRHVLAWVAIGLGVVGCLAFVLLCSVSLFGHVTGQELSPYDFQRREFEYFEIPLIHLQITPIDRKTSTGVFEKHLVDEGFLDAASSVATGSPSATAGKPAGGSQKGAEEVVEATVEKPVVQAADSPTEDAATAKTDGNASSKNEVAGSEAPPSEAAEPERWDLVETRRASVVVSVGDARILCQYLDSKSDDDGQYWLAWTKSHDELARVVWPLVGRLAMQRMYILIPEVLESARSATDAGQFQTEINRSLADRFHQLALSQQQQQRHEVALDLIRDGLTYDPRHEGLLSAQSVGKAAVAPESREVESR
jgi:hypothetical protein